MPHRKSHKLRRGKKTGRKTLKKRGGYYGYGQGPPVAPGAASVTRGSEMPKGGKRSRSRRGRKMRGGNILPVRSAGFDGTGHGGLANYKAVNEIGPNDAVPT